MFNTGTVIGVSANIFGSGFPRNFVPSFSWGGASGFYHLPNQKSIRSGRKSLRTPWLSIRRKRTTHSRTYFLKKRQSIEGFSFKNELRIYRSCRVVKLDGFFFDLRLRVTGYGLRVTGYGLRVTSYGLRVTGYGLRVTGYGKNELMS